MRVAWSRISRGGVLGSLIVIGAPAPFVYETAGFPVALGATLVIGLFAIVTSYVDYEKPGLTVDEWRGQVQRVESRHGCALVSLLLAGCVLAWLVGWGIAGYIGFSLTILRVVTALSIAFLHVLCQLVCIGSLMPTRTPVVPSMLRAEIASRPRFEGAPGGDVREVAPGFVADLDPAAAPPAGAVQAAAPATPLKRVLRLPKVAPWRPATTRRLRASEWRSVIGWRFFAGELLAIGLLAGALFLGVKWGMLLSALGVVAVTAAASARALRWDWPGEVSIADWFRSERSLVRVQGNLANMAEALFIGSALVIGMEALLLHGEAMSDLICGTPLVVGGASVTSMFLWRRTLHRVFGEKPTARAVPEPIRQAVLAVARREEHVESTSGGTQEISVVEEIAGVPLVPERAEEAPPLPALFTVPEAGQMAREAQERVIAEVTRAASLKPDGEKLVRRLEQRLAKNTVELDDDELLMEVAEILFVAFPDRAERLVAAISAIMRPRPPIPKPPEGSGTPPAPET